MHEWRSGAGKRGIPVEIPTLRKWRLKSRGIMMMFRFAPIAITLVLASGTAAWAEEGGRWRGKAVLVTTQVTTLNVADQKDHAMMLGDDHGLVFNEDDKDFLDKAEYRVQWMVDTGGMVGGGYKTFTASDGQVFAKFVITKFTDAGGSGTWEFIGGTGKYKGITGRGNFNTTNVTPTVYWDLLEGEYKIP
jgi:hypothetical protein